MPEFVWKANTRQGQKRSGETETLNKDVAIAVLRRQGLIDIKIKKKPMEIVLFPEKVDEKGVTIFFRQLATMLNAGLPVVQCFELAERG
ncbi:MAG: type II secretion system F family protein, partial [Mariprofundaceae bacterium]